MTQELRDQKQQLIAYLLSKVKSGDWHAVQDAASDIREIDAKLEAIDQITSTFPSDADKTMELNRWLAAEGAK